MENGKQTAYPIVGSAFSDNYQGLTKREYFAGLAMQGLISVTATIGGQSTPKEAKQIICARALLYADELLKQLSLRMW